MASLNDITGISIKGGCYTHDGNPSTLNGILKEPINILFGRNGSGKSTLARALDEYAHPDPTKPNEYEVSFIGGELPPDQRERIFVFNENFVRENVATQPDGLQTIIIMGKEDIESQAKIEQLRKGITDAEDKRKEFDDICKKHEDKKEPTSKTHAWDLLWSAMQAEKKYATRERDIKGNIKKGSVTEDTIRRIADKCRGKAIDPNLQQAFDTKFSQLKTLKAGSEVFWTKPTIKLPFDIDAIATLLAKKVENPELSEREQYLLEVSQQSKYYYVGIMEDDILKNRRSVCPICLQSIGDSQRKTMVEAVTHILNKEVGGHKQELRAALANITKSNYTLPSLLSEIYEDDLSDAQACLDELNRLTEALQNEVEKKIKSPITPITDTTLTSNLLTAMEELRKAFDKLENDIVEYNNNIKNRKKIEQELLEMNDQLAWMEHNLQIEDYFSKVNEYENSIENSRRLTQEIKTLDAEIKELQAAKSDASEAVNVINQSLRTIFSNKIRMQIEYDPEKNQYLLKTRGKGVNPNRISEGERNIIGLSYFFASINANHELNDIYKKPVLLVIDDPISSYDQNNRLGVITFLSTQIDAIMKENKSSKVVLMSHDMQTVQRFTNLYVSIMKRRFKLNIEAKNVKVYQLEDGSSSPMKETQRSSTYKKLMQQVYRYATSSSPEDVEDLAIGNEMRRLLESYCSFNYDDGLYILSSLTEHAYVLSKNEKKRTNYQNFIEKAMLDSESHAQGGWTENPFEYDASYEEKHNAARHALMLLQYLDRSHLNAYLGYDQTGVIMDWCDNDTEW